MNGRLFAKDGHLSPATLEELKDGILPPEDRLAAAEHLSGCRICAERFAEALEMDGLAKVPAGFAEEVRGKMKEIDRNRRQLLFYSLRVTTAMAASLVIIFSHPFAAFINGQTRNDFKAPDFRVVNTISERLTNFSQKVIRLEVFK